MTLTTAISRHIWDAKYRLKEADGTPLDADVDATWTRIAHTLAAIEPEHSRTAHERDFMDALTDCKFLPGGRIIAGAGSGRHVTLFNCFVMGTIVDDMGGIFDGLKEAALTMQAGGGIGYDFSTLRPHGAPVRGLGATASGPLSFMDVWDAMCRTIMSAGHRRGAMMATLRCDHPDIEAFIDAKREPGRLRMFNLSVLLTEKFMDAVLHDAPWTLQFGGVAHRTLQARELWDRIMHATYDYAEPGVIFIDRINRTNNLHYCETISATNPCGEQPLPPYGACLLGSINLTRFIHDPFEDTATLDTEALEHTVTTAVRMLDNTIDASRFPLDSQHAEAQAKRRIGLGLTGLADALIMCGARYGSDYATTLAGDWTARLRRAAYLASTALAHEKGPFPLFDREPYLAGETAHTLDPDIRDEIAQHGIRNALLTSIAPTGTISLLADNISSGIEPIFAYEFHRTLLMPDNSRREEPVTDYALALYRRLRGADAPLPEAFVTAQTLAPSDHVRMQAVVQKHVDSSISKTVHVPDAISFDDFKLVYMQAYNSGCKGCTTYRPNDITGSVLATEPQQEPALPLPEPTPTALTANPESAAVVYMTKPLDRPEALPGQTYKHQWPESNHAIYITINDTVLDGRRRPFEIFINSKNTEHYPWTVALTRMISAVFRRGGDVSFVVDELKAVFDPRGGYWIDGAYIPSLLAAIGNVIEHHMIDIGFIHRTDTTDSATKRPTTVQATQAAPPPASCPRCSQPALVHQEGCDMCTSCGYSKCE